MVIFQWLLIQVKQKNHQNDGKRDKKNCSKKNVPYFTTVAAAIAAVETIKVLKQLMFQHQNQFKSFKRLMDSNLIYLVQTDTTVGFSSSSDEKLSLIKQRPQTKNFKYS